jgi:hypothetical protein
MPVGLCFVLSQSRYDPALLKGLTANNHKNYGGGKSVCRA